MTGHGFGSGDGVVGEHRVDDLRMLRQRDILRLRPVPDHLTDRPHEIAVTADLLGKATAAACVMSLFGLAATSLYLWLQIRDGARAA